MCPLFTLEEVPDLPPIVDPKDLHGGASLLNEKEKTKIDEVISRSGTKKPISVTDDKSTSLGTYFFRQNTGLYPFFKEGNKKHFIYSRSSMKQASPYGVLGRVFFIETIDATGKKSWNRIVKICHISRSIEIQKELFRKDKKDPPEDSELSNKTKRNINNEYSILNALQLNPIKIQLDNNKTLLFSDRIKGVELFKLRGKNLHPRRWFEIIISLLQDTQRLLGFNIIHNDIHACNALYNGSETKLIDFDRAKKNPPDSEKSEKEDSHDLGVTIFFILNCNPPYDEETNKTRLKSIFPEEIVEPFFQHVKTKMMAENSKERPDITDSIKFFTDLKDKCLKRFDNISTVAIVRLNELCLARNSKKLPAFAKALQLCDRVYILKNMEEDPVDLHQIIGTLADNAAFVMQLIKPDSEIIKDEIPIQSIQIFLEEKLQAKNIRCFYVTGQPDLNPFEVKIQLDYGTKDYTFAINRIIKNIDAEKITTIQTELLIEFNRLNNCINKKLKLAEQTITLDKFANSAYLAEQTQALFLMEKIPADILTWQERKNRIFEVLCFMKTPTLSYADVYKKLQELEFNSQHTNPLKARFCRFFGVTPETTGAENLRQIQCAVDQMVPTTLYNLPQCQK